MRIIIYGTGTRCEYLLESRRSLFTNYEIIAYSNEEESTWGRYFHGKLIIPSKEIMKYDFDFIYLAEDPYTNAYKEMYRYLTEELKIDKNLIKEESYLDILYSIKQAGILNERLRAGTNIKENDLRMIDTCKIVIYTAIYGNYDYLKEPKYIDPNIDYVCFTDNKYFQSKTWEVRYVDNQEESNLRRKAKIFRVLPHKFFPNYDYSVWIDGTFRICGDIREYIKKYMKYTNILCSAHPWRDDIYEEADYCLSHRKFAGVNELKKQIAYYEQQGLPHHNGLISSGVLVRKHNEKDVIASMEHWWEQICRFSTQDQNSFAYIAWKDNLKFDVSPEYYYKNEYWIAEPHCFQTECFHLADISLLKNKKVVLYGAGSVGKSYYNQICQSKDVILTGWVDKNYMKAQVDYYPVTSVESLKTLDYDVVLIAIRNKDIAGQISVKLREKGIENNKILWVDPSEGYFGTI